VIQFHPRPVRLVLGPVHPEIEDVLPVRTVARAVVTCIAPGNLLRFPCGLYPFQRNDVDGIIGAACHNRIWVPDNGDLLSIRAEGDVLRSAQRNGWTVHVPGGEIVHFPGVHVHEEDVAPLPVPPVVPVPEKKGILDPGRGLRIREAIDIRNLGLLPWILFSEISFIEFR